jgi:two-component system, cell cycle sensor histidine kinase and response regulator CckA
VLAASNGGEALALFEAHKDAVDLIVTDLVMPGMSGSELGRLIAQRKSGVPVLFTSGYSGEMLAHHGVEPGSAFLEKPYDEDDLARVMRALLDPPAAGSA